jgi:hypothetical protein
MYRPEGFDFTESHDARGRHFVYRPSRLAALGTGLFALFWNAFVVFWMTMAANGAGPFALFGTLHLGVGVWLAYSSLLKLFNTQRISFEGDALRSHNGPIPARGNFVIPLADIDGFSVQFHAPNRSRSTSYSVHVNRSSGQTQRLSLETSHRVEAEYACHVLGEALVEAKRPKGGLYRGAQPGTEDATQARVSEYRGADALQTTDELDDDARARRHTR